MKLGILLTFLYFFLVLNLFYQQILPDRYPYLRERLGTILSHSSDGGGESHFYCYYPSKSEYKKHQQGEQIIMKVEVLDDCQGWYGVAEFNEGPWVSEIEKFWWNKAQKELETSGLAEKNHNSQIDPI